MGRFVAAGWLCLLLVLGAAPASAAGISFYTDQAAWLAAVSGFSVQPYADTVTIADTTTTLTRGFPPCDPSSLCFSGNTVATTTQTGFTSLVRSLNFFSNDCYVACSGLTDTAVTFSSPIYGLSASATVCGTEVFTINGQAMPFLSQACPINQFFGLVSDEPLLSLDFNAGCCTDSRNLMALRDIAVAVPVPEPSTLALLAAGVGTIVGRKRKRQATPCPACSSRYKL